MRVTAFAITGMLIFCSFGYVSLFNVSAVPPGNQYLLPDADIDISPDADYPGTWGAGWYSYDHTPGINSFAEELRVNSTSYPVYYKSTQTNYYYQCSFDDLIIEWDYFEIKFYLIKTGAYAYYHAGLLDTEGGTENYVSGSTNAYMSLPLNPMTNEPWTLAEINGMEGFITGFMPTDAVPEWYYFLLTVIPIDYEPPVLTIDYILRPNTDDTSVNMDWTNQSEPYRFAEINETDSGGDYTDSLIYAYNKYGSGIDRTYNATFGFTDLPSDMIGYNIGYKLTLWAIGWSNKTDSVIYDTFAMAPYFEGIAGEYYYDNINMVDTHHNQSGYEYWRFTPYQRNFTIELNTNPYTGSPWRWFEVNDIIVWICGSFHHLYGGDENGQMNITQMGIWVTASDALFLSPIGDEFEKTFYGLIWLIIVFLPAIAIGKFVPLGFHAGLLLMLAVLSISQPGFMSVLVIGYLAIGINIYKGH